jgi:hypothetical protein
MGGGIDRLVEREIQPLELDLVLKVQGGGRLSIEKLIQPHTVVRLVGLVLTLLQLSLADSELRSDKVGLRGLVSRILCLHHAGTLFQISDVPGVNAYECFVEQNLVIRRLHACPQVAHRRFVG